MRSAPIFVALALAPLACAEPCVRVTERDPGPPTLVVTTSDLPDAPQGSSCVGFEDCPLRWQTTGTGTFRQVTTALTFEGWTWSLSVDGEGATLCRGYFDDTMPIDQCQPWACAESGSVVLTAGGGGSFSALFSGGRRIDATFPASTP